MAITPPVSSTSLEDLLGSGQELRSTFDEIVQNTKFRILILGRAGVGKSSLVNSVFKIDLAAVKHGIEAGVSDIEREFTSEQNPRLIIHDSQGFSTGDKKNLEIVQEFIKTRSKKPYLKDRLHVIWLCTAVPTYGAGLLEVADESILDLKDPIRVPVIVVLTKFDTFVDKMLEPSDEDLLAGDVEDIIKRFAGTDMSSTTSAMTSEPAPVVNPWSTASKTDRDRIDKELEDRFVTPMLVKRYPGVSWARVSVSYSDTLDVLVVKTQDYIEESLQLLFATVQQKNVTSKVEATIEIGKKRYWKGLATAFRFPGNSQPRWFQVVHKDILKVWEPNFGNAPDLESATIEVSKLQSDLVKERPQISQAVTVLPAVAAVIGGVIPPAAPVAVPVAVGILFAAWVYEAVYVTRGVLRGMMAYIIDLTLIMEHRFLMQTKQVPCLDPTNLFKQSLTAYTGQGGRRHAVHESIRDFVSRSKALQSNKVISEIKRIIMGNLIKAENQGASQVMLNR